ncbi:MAG: hypothetical protein AB8B71_20395 [Paracoccaceae bacterium]
MSLTVNAHERGLVRVFALSMTNAQAKALKASKDSKVLGLSAWDTKYVEVFPLSDLEDLGLIGYLETGCGVDPADLKPDRQKLMHLTGWVLLVYSAAFSGQAVKLAPNSGLALIGTYGEPEADWADAQVLSSEAAQISTAPVRKKPSDAAMSGRIATMALLVLFALTALMVWVAS